LIEERFFSDDSDRDDLLDRLGGILCDSKTPCPAWAFMINHLHLLLRTDAAPIVAGSPETLSGIREERGCSGTPARFNGRRIGAKRRRMVREVIDGRRATKNGKGSECVMLLRDAGTWDGRGRDIEKTEHRVLDGKRIRAERTADRQRAGVEAFG
jgi:hypothetical protein